MSKVGQARRWRLPVTAANAGRGELVCDSTVPFSQLFFSRHSALRLSGTRCAPVRFIAHTALRPKTPPNYNTSHLLTDARGGPYSPWNETRCPSDRATCCASGFNPSSVGCCPWPNAVCCPGAQYQCCPSGTTCKLAEGSGYDARYNCSAADGSVVINRATCKSGPPLPMSTSLKNVLWIGDSLSLGMIPHVAANLSDVALVQHAPWGGDGGAEETTYGGYCLDYFLASPSGMPIKMASLPAPRSPRETISPPLTISLLPPRNRNWCCSTLECTMGRCLTARSRAKTRRPTTTVRSSLPSWPS